MATTQMQVTIPDGLKEGSTFNFNAPNGQIMTVSVPPGHYGGMALMVNVPAAAPAPAVVAAAPTVVSAAPVMATMGAPVVVVQDSTPSMPVIAVQDLGKGSLSGVCPHCQQQIMTVVKKEECTTDQLLASGGLGCIICLCCWPCLPCALCGLACSPDYRHSCPKCNYYIGHCRGMKANDRRGQ